MNAAVIESNDMPGRSPQGRTLPRRCLVQCAVIVLVLHAGWLSLTPAFKSDPVMGNGRPIVRMLSPDIADEGTSMTRPVFALPGASGFSLCDRDRPLRVLGPAAGLQAPAETTGRTAAFVPSAREFRPGFRPVPDASSSDRVVTPGALRGVCRLVVEDWPAGARDVALTELGLAGGSQPWELSAQISCTEDGTPAGIVLVKSSERKERDELVLHWLGRQVYVRRAGPVLVSVRYEGCGEGGGAP